MRIKFSGFFLYLKSAYINGNYFNSKCIANIHTFYIIIWELCYSIERADWFLSVSDAFSRKNFMIFIIISLHRKNLLFAYILNLYVMLWYHLFYLKNVKNTHRIVSLLVNCRHQLKVSLRHGCFLRFLNYVNSTKMRKTSHMYI